MAIKSYIKTFFSKRKFYSHISFFAFWDYKTVFSNKVLLAPLTRLNNVEIGDFTRIKPLCNIFHAKIGKYCSIAKGVKIGLGRHPTNLISTNSIFYKSGIYSHWKREIGFVEEVEVSIGNDVWIGLESIVLDGVKIGDGAIIGARSLVTKDVPPYAIAVGMPAKVIKYRFEQDVINRLLEIKWWNLSEDEISTKLPLFTSNKITLELLNEYFPNERK